MSHSLMSQNIFRVFGLKSQILVFKRHDKPWTVAHTDAKIGGKRFYRPYSFEDV